MISIVFGQKNDSITKKYRWFINTYPSALITGDFSIGTEFNYKHIRQEVAFFYKSFSVLDNSKTFPYKYDKGFGFNYYIKYNLIKRQKHLLSFDLGYSYIERSFDNKNAKPDFLRYLSNQNAQAISSYNMDRKEKLQGFNVGFSNIFALYKRFNCGFNLSYGLFQRNNSYQLNYYVSGGILFDETTQKEISLPYKSSYTNRQESLNFLIKIIYEIK
ncbi:MAG: hypothetical protein SFY56_05525 [Bacteroidota bacterium]|nr:hypothetical protein [Bacteroidota bacterium]